MNVVSLVILLASAVCEEARAGVGVVVPLDIAGAQVMAEGVTVLVPAHLDVAVCRPEVEATADHHHLIVDGMRSHMLTEMALGKDAEAGAERGDIISNFESMQPFFELCLLCLDLVTTM